MEKKPIKNDPPEEEEKNKQEKINALVSQVMDRIKSRKELTEKIATLVEERNKLLEQGESPEAKILSLKDEINKLREEENNLVDKISQEESKLMKAQENMDKLTNEHWELAEKSPGLFKWRERKKHKEDLSRAQSDKERSIDESNMMQKNLSEMLEKKDKIIKILRDKQKALRELERDIEAKKTEKKIKEDQNKRPFLYYLLQKNQNPYLSFKNEETGLQDIRNCTWATSNETRGQYDSLKKINNGEGYFYFSFSGFVLAIKNVESLRGKDGIDATSEKGIFRVVGPDGKTVNDDIKGYSKAYSLYNDAITAYENKMREEFNNLNK
ncbi:MAG TPA: hypothetical protein VFQ59_01870 [Candidatus Paceibacterota bacterium]|nr:hypothetical protein [Candidatus Paceibacterota bacterium]